MRVYHIAEFAETMENNGYTYQPTSPPDIEPTPPDKPPPTPPNEPPKPSPPKEPTTSILPDDFIGKTVNIDGRDFKIEDISNTSQEVIMLDLEMYKQGFPISRVEKLSTVLKHIKEEPKNYKITDKSLGVGTPKERFKNNIQAIKTLKKIELENRTATKSEQEILSKYVG